MVPSTRASAQSPDSIPLSGPALYRRLLKDSWLDLHPAVRRCHLDGAPVRGAGRFQISGGRTGLARLLGRLAGLPPAGEGLETRLSVTPEGEGELWVRAFGDHRLVSRQRPAQGGILAERFGRLELRFRLEVFEGELRYRQAGASLRLGRRWLALPRWAAPRVSAWERPFAPDPSRTQVDVRVTLPALGELLSYTGSIGCEVSS